MGPRRRWSLRRARGPAGRARIGGALAAVATGVLAAWSGAPSVAATAEAESALTRAGDAGAARIGAAMRRAADGGGDGPPLLYVASQEDATVAVLDGTSGELLRTVDLQAMGFSATAKPHHVAVEPDGSFWYVSLIADGRVLKLDQDDRLAGQADFETPGMLALDPESDLLYVGRSMAAVNPPHRIGMVRRSTMEIEEVDVFLSRPHALAVDRTGRRVFTASLGENRMAYGPLGAEEVELAGIEGPHHMPVQLATSPDGRWLVAGGQMSGELLVWDLSGTAPEPVRTLPVGGEPWHPSFTPDGAELWIPEQAAGAVTVVDVATWTVAARIEHPALAEPHGSAVSPDGRLVFVSGRNTRGGYGTGRPGTVVTIDRRSREVVRVAEVGRYAAGMGIAGGKPGHP